MTTTIAMQQAAAGAAPAQPLPPNMQEAADLAARVQAQVQAKAAELEAEAALAAAADAQAGAEGQPTAVVRSPDGSIVIRDGQTGETTVIEGIPPWVQNGPPEGVFMIPVAFFAAVAFVIVGLPIARAFGRRMDAKNATQAAVAPSAELRQLQTSVDAMAVEIERMSEHQRFLTRVLSEGRQDPAPAARDASSAVPR